jgi:hypothetical protein
MWDFRKGLFGVLTVFGYIFCSYQRKVQKFLGFFVHLCLTFSSGADKIDSVWCTLPHFGVSSVSLITGDSPGEKRFVPDLGFCCDFCRFLCGYHA